MIRIILVRHGRTAWNAREGQGPRFRGTIDLPLAKEGVAQAEITARRLADEPLAAIYSSPLQRAARTAEIISGPHALPVRILSGLGSMDYGDWAGEFHSDVARRWPHVYRQWQHNPFSIQIPGGESHNALRERAVAALREILSRHDDGDTIAVISHQVVTRTLVCVLAELPDPGFRWIRQALCNLTRFDHEPACDEFTVVGLNDMCHLNPALPGADAEGARLVLVRHGQTGWNAPSRVVNGTDGGQERFRGRTDLPLDETGQVQAHAVAEQLKGEPIAAIYASPLLRALQTAQPLAGGLGLKIQPHDGLLDINYGHFQGLTHAKAAETYPDLYSLWRTAPGQVHFPSGECLADVQSRLLALLDELAARHSGQTIVLVGHQIVNKVLACTLLGVGGSTERKSVLDHIWRIQQDTAGINVFQQSDGRWHILRLNDTCHL
jgi:probable phosphoglycerate mutase